MTTDASSDRPTPSVLRHVVNGRGPATVLGAAQAAPGVAEAVVAMLGRSVHMSELQSHASATAERVLGVPAACFTGCSAAGIAIGISAAITGSDLAKITALPDVPGSRSVMLPKAHVITAGGLSVNQLIYMAGGEPSEVGEAADCASYHVRAGLSRSPSAAVYVLGERANAGGILPLREYATLCRGAGVPVIVDAAGSTSPAGIFEEGADLVIVSGHKWFRGATAGMIAGRSDLVHAAYLVGEFGIGRAMKVGKEGIAGFIAALESWERGMRPADPEGHRAVLSRLADQLTGISGLSVNMLESFAESGSSALLRIDVDPRKTGISAWELSRALEEGTPSLAVDDYQAADGYIVVDPGFFAEDDEQLFAERILQLLAEFREFPSSSAIQPVPARFDVLTEAVGRWRWSPR